MFCFKQPKLKGFTLIEVIAVIAIIGILTALSLVSLSSSRASSKLISAQREVASAVRLAQSYAVSGKIATSGPATGKTPDGYGMSFTNSTDYRIFYRESGIDTAMESFKLSGGVKLKTPGSSRVYFEIPHGVPDVPRTYTLQISSAPDKTVTITKEGLITEN